MHKPAHLPLMEDLAPAAFQRMCVFRERTHRPSLNQRVSPPSIVLSSGYFAELLQAGVSDTGEMLSVSCCHLGVHLGPVCPPVFVTVMF